jgi:hypothetical protein
MSVRSHAEKHSVEFGNGISVGKQGHDFAFIRLSRGLDRYCERIKVELSHLIMHIGENFQ